MKKHVMKKWIKALRSGEYKQGKNRLQNGNRFCCLGVLCAISPKSVSKTLEPGTLFLYGANLFAQDKVRKWANLRNSEGGMGEIYSLADFNDIGTSFEAIADIIEKNWEKL